MTKDFDLIVIGAGMAGVTAAHVCASAGWSVAIVDERPYGGTCALRGCDPKKMLRRGAEIVEAARLMRGKGIRDDGLSIDWADLVAFKQSFVEDMPGRIESGLKDKGIATWHGSARFTGGSTLAVNEDHLEAGRILIATGACPRPLGIPGEEYLTTSTQFMDLTALPSRILFVGGGYVSSEFAHIAARTGAKVHMIDRGERPLEAFDPDLVARLVERGREAGIEFEGTTELKAVKKDGGEYQVLVEQAGKSRHIETGLVVHGAGRIANLERLDLDVAGIDWSEKGVHVDARLRSRSNRSVYAAGDAADTEGAPLTPVGVLEGKRAAKNMLDEPGEAPDYRGVPSVVFTLPELASVGMSEEEAKKATSNLRVAFNDTGGWFSNRRIGESCGAAKVLIDEDGDRIVGAHLLGDSYSELINIFALAIRHRLGARDLKDMIAAYPTLGSDLGSLL
ncbi:putative FAD-dependent pyridine nucleotide-disulphide oxidoreductase [Marinicauda pacifica]|uniref:NAD(P)/FAD-dependent oxidoreductase n=1 Tax=Marinicauda pacifica TaxID=1133559 RepID=A0A4S2HFJ8_9PROT|nr:MULTISPECIES: NAD(P)/FAD-dependent oxidoreductase [Marinicauda]TGY94826.1 NAD(P)/FAD-dependent oxidoreductase [Marinicauda pacifica]GGE39165.1 putative FAD-dependent pyridine nucleotide-disulphide oxidoreductase [Marinicauda pacifica]